MINIENESSLHNTLKAYYCSMYEGKTEVNSDNHIYDIVAKNGTIIEIQTQNLSSLYKKIKDILEIQNKKIILVHPVVISKKINVYDSEGKLISSRKSSKKGNIYDIFSQLTKIYPFLLNKNFKLEIIEVNIIEERIKTNSKVQSLNKRRRRKLDWNKTNKRLEEIINTICFSTKDDYLSLLPHNLPEQFSSKELKEKLKELKIPARIYNNSNIILWVLSRMELIVQTDTKNRFKYYKINS